MSGEEEILTIRLIRSFHHRNLKNFVLKHVDKHMLVKDFKELIKQEVKKSNLPPPFKTYSYDTLKIEHVPFKAKSNDPVINCEDDDLLILSDDKKLSDYPNIEADSSFGTFLLFQVNETEISFFVLNEYLEYKSNKYVTLG